MNGRYLLTLLYVWVQCSQTVVIFFNRKEKLCAWICMRPVVFQTEHKPVPCQTKVWFSLNVYAHTMHPRLCVSLKKAQQRHLEWFDSKKTKGSNLKRRCLMWSLRECMKEQMSVKRREMLGWMTKGRLNHWCYIFNKPFEFLFLSLWTFSGPSACNIITPAFACFKEKKQLAL